MPHSWTRSEFIASPRNMNGTVAGNPATIVKNPGHPPGPEFRSAVAMVRNSTGRTNSGQSRNTVRKNGTQAWPSHYGSRAIITPDS